MKTASAGTPALLGVEAAGFWELEATASPADLMTEISSNAGSGPSGRLLVSRAVVVRNRLPARLSPLSE